MEVGGRGQAAKCGQEGEGRGGECDQEGRRRQRWWKMGSSCSFSSNPEPRLGLESKPQPDCSPPPSPNVLKSKMSSFFLEF